MVEMSYLMRGGVGGHFWLKSSTSLAARLICGLFCKNKIKMDTYDLEWLRQMEKKFMLRLYAYQTKAKDPGNTVVAKNPVLTSNDL